MVRDPFGVGSCRCRTLRKLTILSVSVVMDTLKWSYVPRDENVLGGCIHSLPFQKVLGGCIHSLSFSLRGPGSLGRGAGGERRDGEAVVCGPGLWQRPAGAHTVQRRGESHQSDAQLHTHTLQRRRESHTWVSPMGYVTHTPMKEWVSSEGHTHTLRWRSESHGIHILSVLSEWCTHCNEAVSPIEYVTHTPMKGWVHQRYTRRHREISKQ